MQVTPTSYLKFAGLKLEEYPPRPEHIATDQSSQPETSSVDMGRISAFAERQTQDQAQDRRESSARPRLPKWDFLGIGGGLDSRASLEGDPPRVHRSGFYL